MLSSGKGCQPPSLTTRVGSPGPTGLQRERIDFDEFISLALCT